MHDPSCIFCKIVKGDIPSYKIYEDDKFLAFLDIAQFVEGHTLLIPKEHFEFVWDITYIGEYYKTAKQISDHFRKRLGYKYVDSATFGRDVPHAHLHLIPHNETGTDWEKALKEIGNMQKHSSRRINPSEGSILIEKFRLSRIT